MIIAVVGLALSAVITDLHAAMLSVGIGPETSDWLVKNSGWRILMLFGAAAGPAHVPDPPVRARVEPLGGEKRKGSTSHWQTVDLLGVLIGAAAACGLIALWAVPDLADRGSACSARWRCRGHHGRLPVPDRAYVRRAEVSADAGAKPPRRGRTSARRGTAGRGRDVRSPLAVRAIVGRLLLAAALSGVALLGTWGSTQQAPT